MNFKDNFDNLIDFIESNIYIPKPELMQLIKKNFSYGNPAQLAYAFDYITGIRLNEYIIKRKLINVLKYKKENDCTIEDAALKFDYSSATNYMRDFKKYYCTTASNMTDEEFSVAIKPFYITTILETEKSTDMKTLVTIPEKMLFDTPISQLSKIKEAFFNMEFFGFDENEAEIAYQLTKNTGLSIDSIFCFCSDYFDHVTYIGNSYPNIKIENLAILCVKTDVRVLDGLEMMLEIDRHTSIKNYKDIPDIAWNIITDTTRPVLYQTEPHLVLYIIDEIKKANIPLSETAEVFDFLELYECIDDGIEAYKNGEDPYKDYCDDTKENIEEYYQKLQEYYEDVEATFTSDFLGY